MKTIIYKEAEKKGEVPAAVKQQLVDLDVKIRTKFNTGRNIKMSKPRPAQQTGSVMKPNYLLRLL